MRKTAVNALALATLLASAGLTLGQQQAPKTTESREPAPAKQEKTPAVKSKLEEMLAEALKNNPDIRVAAAKVAEADAELNRTRLQVTQKVIALHHALLSQKAAVEYEQKKYERLKNLAEKGAVDSALLDEARQALTLAKAKLAELEAQLPAMLGKVARSADAWEAQAIRVWELDAFRAGELDLARLAVLSTRYRELRQHKAQGPMADKLRESLKKPISLKVSNEYVSDLLQHLQKQTSIALKLMSDGLPEPRLNLELTNLSLVAVLQFIEDSEPGYRFVIREYGILFAPQAKLPPGAVTIQEFLHEKSADAPRGLEAKPRNPPSENVEGVVKRVEESSGLMTISIGSDAGLAKGHTLELFRLAEEPRQSKYLGTVRILEVSAKESVAQPVGRLADKPKVGDHVASQLRGK
jgi:hypothetical protein